MGYCDYLKQLLAPLHIYELDEGFSGGEILALGTALDSVTDALGEVQREMFLSSAESYGLDAYEELLPFTPESPGLADRRRAIQALLQIDGTAFTP